MKFRKFPSMFIVVLMSVMILFLLFRFTRYVQTYETLLSILHVRERELELLENVPEAAETESASTAPNDAPTFPANPLLSITNDRVVPDGPDSLSVHFVRLYTAAPSSFCWTECIALLSVILYVRPSRIYFHTNYPDYWPFDTCYMITDFSLVYLVYVRRRFRLGGHVLKEIAHEADVIKYSVAYEYGGIVLDSDVYLLPKMTVLVKKWKRGQYDCLLTRESELMNAGFIACRRGHPYVRQILLRYAHDYHDDWLYNSGAVPRMVYQENPDFQRKFYVDDQMSDHNSWYDGPIGYREIPAWHSYTDECGANEKNTRHMAVNSTFWEMVHFIVEEGHRMLPYTTTPATTTAIETTADVFE